MTLNDSFFFWFFWLQWTMMKSLERHFVWMTNVSNRRTKKNINSNMEKIFTLFMLSIDSHHQKFHLQDSAKQRNKFNVYQVFCHFEIPHHSIIHRRFSSLFNFFFCKNKLRWYGNGGKCCCCYGCGYMMMKRVHTRAIVVRI